MKQIKFESFAAWSSDGLNKKVNKFLISNPEIEIVDIKLTAGFGDVYAAILYR